MSGLKPNEIQIFTAQDSGRQIKIKKVPSRLMDDLRSHVLRQLPEPKPPVNRVNYGTDEEPHWQEEPNPADPGYAYLHSVWEEQFRDRMARQSQELMFDLGVYPYLEMNEEKTAEVQALRDYLRAKFDMVLEDDDKTVYLNRIVLTTPEDIQDLITFLIRRNQPTEAAIAEAARKFPG